jgi:hypothetical protein
MSLTLGVCQWGLVGWVYSMTFKENKKPKGRQGKCKHKFGVVFSCVWEKL